jgi:GDP-L-fucose synthase
MNSDARKNDPSGRPAPGLNPESRIFVAGHRGMVGSALVRRLQAEGYSRIITRAHAELDLTDQQAVRTFFRRERIDVVFLAAAKVGGIHANHTYPADFIYRNTMIQANTIQAAYEAGIDRLLFLGSSCIYPSHAPQPMIEEYLLGGYLEPTNLPYAVAKIGGIILCESYNRQYGTHYRAVMPTNLYGPEDNFNLQNSHVLPALMRKLHLAKLIRRGEWEAVERDAACFGPIGTDVAQAIGLSGGSQLTLWGTGSPRREFLHVDDLASACVQVMRISDPEYAGVCDGSQTGAVSLAAGAPGRVNHVNVGCGNDLTIRELAEKMQAVVGFDGELGWNPDRPDGMMRKLLDVTRITRLGWKPALGLEQGLVATYRWYLQKTAAHGSRAAAVR